MKISAKGRYAIAAMIELAGEYSENTYIPIIKIANKLDISKIYLEQVFSLLKKSGLVISVKGPQGGYKLRRDLDEINVYDILKATETTMFEKTEETVKKKEAEIDLVMRKNIFDLLDKEVEKLLKNKSLKLLLEEVEREREKGEGYIYFI